MIGGLALLHGIVRLKQVVLGKYGLVIVHDQHNAHIAIIGGHELIETGCAIPLTRPLA